jgi:hypothetical protein
MPDQGGYMIRSFDFTDIGNVERFLDIAKTHIKYIEKSKSKEIRIPGVLVDHALIVSIFSAAAIEAALNLYVAIPVLYIQDPDTRSFMANLLTRCLRMSVPAKIRIVCQYNDTIAARKKLLKDIQELFAFRNSIMHSTPEYWEGDWLSSRFSDAAGYKPGRGQSIPSLSVYSESSDEFDAALRHFKVAQEFLKELKPMRPKKLTTKDAEALHDLIETFA